MRSAVRTRFLFLLVAIGPWVSRASASFECTLVGGKGGGGRIPLVFFPEAFASTERVTFDSAVAQAVRNLFTYSPYKEYRDWFAIYEAWTPSELNITGYAPSPKTVFGVYNPKGDVPILSGTEPFLRTQVDTAFRCRDRDPAFLRRALSVIVARFVGGGGISTGNRLTVVVGFAPDTHVLPHELGHALGALVDEYGQATPGASHFDAQGMPLYGPVPNVAASLDRIPWKALIDPATPVPTPDGAAYDTAIGAFEGGDLRNTGRWRPARQCLMRGGDAFHAPRFCRVCRQAVVAQILQDSALYSRILGRTPGVRLRLDTVSPAPGQELSSGRVVVRFPATDLPSLRPRWRFAGRELGTGDTLDLDTLAGTGTLEAILEGRSPFILEDGLVPRDTLRWSIREPVSVVVRPVSAGIRRLGPALFLFDGPGDPPRRARDATGRVVALRAVARGSSGLLLQGDGAGPLWCEPER